MNLQEYKDKLLDMARVATLAADECYYQGDDKNAAVWAEIYKQVFTLQMRIVEV